MSLPQIDPELEHIVAKDLHYLEELVSKTKVSNDEIGRASVTLRKLIVYDDLQRVANARRKRLHLNIPDARMFLYNVEEDDDIVAFQLGGYRALGLEMMAATLAKGNRARPLKSEFDPSARIAVPLKTFSKQGVFHLKIVQPAGEAGVYTSRITVTRAEVIKYVANKMGYAHYDTQRDRQADMALDDARRMVVLSLQNGIPTLSLDVNALQDPVYRASKSPPGIGQNRHDEHDLVLLEMLGAARLLVESEAVKELQELIST